MSDDNFCMWELQQQINLALATDDQEEMTEALIQCQHALREANKAALAAGNRKERAERVFDLLGFDKVAAYGRKGTGHLVCIYILNRMHKDGKERPSQIYYDAIANNLGVEVRVVQRYWNAGKEFFTRPYTPRYTDKKDTDAHLLELIKFAYRQEGQRLVKK